MSLLTTIGVMGSHESAHREQAMALGALIARKNYNLLTGGGAGAMEAVCESYCAARAPGSLAKCIGILPSWTENGNLVTATPNHYVEIAIKSPLGKFTKGMDDFTPTRNHTNVLTADLVLALPGGEGTANEIFLAQCFEKPVLLYGPEEALNIVANRIEPKYKKYGKPFALPERTTDIARVEAFLVQNLGL